MSGDVEPIGSKRIWEVGGERWEVSGFCDP
jgi:hypothetical protein